MAKNDAKKKIKLGRGSKNFFPAHSAESNGQLLIATDEQALYHDLSAKRIELYDDRPNKVKFGDKTEQSIGGKTLSLGALAEKNKVTDSDLDDGTISKTKIAGDETGKTLVDDLAKKVDKVEDKGLSKNDFDDDAKTKLTGIEAGAEVNVQSDYTETDDTKDSFIKNKPTLGALAAKDKITDDDVDTAAAIAQSKISGLETDLGNKANKTDLNDYRKSADQDVIDNAIKGRLDAIEGKEAGWDAKQEAISDLETIRSGAGKGATALQPTDVIDGLESTETQKPLSANQGKALKKAIDDLSKGQRYLTTWDATTGKPETNPPGDLPYAYKAGDFYKVGKIAAEGGTNYKPDGSSYTGAASKVVESETIKVGGSYTYDGSVWTYKDSIEVVGVQDVSADGTSVVENGVAKLGGLAKVGAKVSNTNVADDAAIAQSKIDGLGTALDAKVAKETGKSLIEDTKITKLDNISAEANKVVKGTANGTISIDGGDDVTIYDLPQAGAAIGGIVADAKGTDETQECKIDTTTGKMYTKPGEVLDNADKSLTINHATHDAKVHLSTVDNNALKVETTSGKEGLYVEELCWEDYD